MLFINEARKTKSGCMKDQRSRKCRGEARRTNKDQVPLPKNNAGSHSEQINWLPPWARASGCCVALETQGNDCIESGHRRGWWAHKKMRVVQPQHNINVHMHMHDALNAIELPMDFLNFPKFFALCI